MGNRTDTGIAVDKGERGVVMVLAVGLIATTVPMPAGGSPGAQGPEEAGFYEDWPLDTDGNGLHERLDERLDRGATGRVVVELHYDEHPLDEDVERVRETANVFALYRYSNWDALLVRTTYDDLRSLADLPRVLGVEWMPKATVDLETSARTVRVLPANVVGGGFDHSRAVHSSLGVRGEGTVVAVLDTGVDNTHEALDDLDDVVATVDPKLVTKPASPGDPPLIGGAEISNNLQAVGCVDPPDTNGHGTHVAATAVGTGIPNSHVGMAPQARLVDVGLSAVSAAGTSGTPIGLDWLLDFNQGDTCFGDPGEHRIDVVSMSLSVGTNDPNASINRKITDLVREGMTFVASAGNAGPDQRSLTKGPEGAVYVAASDDRETIERSDDVLANFSSRGPRPADGDADRLDELRPDVAAPGVAIEAALAGSRQQAQSLSGTSMATPHVSGIAALVLQANPDLRPVDRGRNEAMGGPGAVPVRDLLIQTAEQRTAVDAPDILLERTGRFDLPWNNAWGYGLVDGYAAVEQAPSFDPVTEPPLLANASAQSIAATGGSTTLVGQAAGGEPGYSFEWTLPDGSTAAGREVNVAFDTDGQRTVEVEVTDAAGQTTREEVSIFVRESPLQLEPILDDAYAQTEDGVYLVDPGDNTGPYLEGRLVLRDADGRPFAGVRSELLVFYRGAEESVGVGTGHGPISTDRDGVANFTIAQDVPGLLLRGFPASVSLTGYHNAEFRLGEPFGETLEMPYWVGPGRPTPDAR